MPENTTPSEQSDFQTPNGNFLWSENTWFGIAVPERKIHGLFYVWHRPHLNLTTGGVAFWDGKGEELHDCLYSAWDLYMPFPSDGDVFNYTLANGATIQTLEPLKSFRLGFTGDGCELDATWEGFIETQHMNFTGTSLDDSGKGHCQQAGRVRGTLRIGDESFVVDARTERDHTWGVRGHDLRINIGYDYAYASDTSGFSVCVLCDEPERESNGSVGLTGDKLLFGWYLKDGVLSKLVSARRWVEQGDDGRPLRFVTDGRDELGRDLHVEGRLESKLNWSGPYRLFMAGVSFELDGNTVWGETQCGNMNPQAWRGVQRERWTQQPVS